MVRKEKLSNIRELKKGINDLRQEQEELKFYLLQKPEKKWKNLPPVSYDKQALENNIARIEINIERIEQSIKNEQESMKRIDEAIGILKKQQIARS
jgi:chromosome segregation ATPase